MSKEAKEYVKNLDIDTVDFEDGGISQTIAEWLTDFANEQTQPLKDEIKRLKKVIRKQKEVIESCQIG